MQFKTFGELEMGDKFITPKIRNHPYDIAVWTKLNDSYKYLNADATYENNAESLYCYTAFGKKEMVIKLNADEAKEQEGIYKQWASKYVSKHSAETKKKEE